MRQLINELSEEFIVVVDVPPLLPVTDASLLSHSVDGVILVGSIGRSHREQMTEAASILKKVNANLFGMVLNRAPRKGLGNSYYGFGYASAYVGYAPTTVTARKATRSRQRSPRPRSNNVISALNHRERLRAGWAVFFCPSRPYTYLVYMCTERLL